MNTDLIVKRILLTPVAAGFGWLVATMIVIGLNLALPTVSVPWIERAGPIGAIVGIAIFLLDDLERWSLGHAERLGPCRELALATDCVTGRVYGYFLAMTFPARNAEWQPEPVSRTEYLCMDTGAAFKPQTISFLGEIWLRQWPSYLVKPKLPVPKTPAIT